MPYKRLLTTYLTFRGHASGATMDYPLAHARSFVPAGSVAPSSWAGSNLSATNPCFLSGDGGGATRRLGAKKPCISFTFQHRAAAPLACAWWECGRHPMPRASRQKSWCRHARAFCRESPRAPCREGDPAFQGPVLHLHLLDDDPGVEVEVAEARMVMLMPRRNVEDGAIDPEWTCAWQR